MAASGSIAVPEVSGKASGKGSMLLSPEEVADLTGYCYPSKQMTWLCENGYKHEVGGDGKPKLLRTYVYSRLGGMVEQSSPEPKLHLR